MAVIPCLGCDSDDEPSKNDEGSKKALEMKAESQHQPTKPPKRTWAIDGAKVLQDDESDTPMKTQVEMRVSIPRDTSPESLDAYLKGKYRELAQRKFTERTHANSIFLFVFLEGDKWDSAGWVGRAALSPMDKSPTFNNELIGGELSGVKKALGIKANPGPTEPSAKKVDNTIEITAHHTEFLSDEYAERVDEGEVWETVFNTLMLVYSKVPKADQLHLLLKHRSDTLIDLTISAKEYQALHYDETIEAAGKDAQVPINKLASGDLTPDQAQEAEDAIYLKAYKDVARRIASGKLKLHSTIKL